MGVVETLLNVNPKLYVKSDERILTDADRDEDVVDEFDEREVFDLIRNINDPEHPLTLEELNVVDLNNIKVNNEKNEIIVHFTPTIPHCSMATLIGLTIRVQLQRSLPARFKIKVLISPGTHSTEDAINKQLGDKERVAAATENTALVQTINQCLATVEKYC
ncbi:MIP18 family protein galla-2 [Rhodnius prolixus]|uniref:FeS_assembly_P domain-containing protein n=2 Tax=Rhodnius TaxID=13248 RepID=R4G418_RHOPR